MHGITRVEVIDHRPCDVCDGTGWMDNRECIKCHGGGLLGRVYVAHAVEVETSLQDDGRTLKIFVNRPKTET